MSKKVNWSKNAMDYQDNIKIDGLFSPKGTEKLYQTNTKKDMVNHPPHYLQGNILKYLWRYRYKNGIEDLKKADWYLQKLISTVERQESDKN